MDTTTIGPRPGRGVLLLLALVVAAAFSATKVRHEAAMAALEPVVDVPAAGAVGSNPTAPPPDLAAIPGGTADWWSTVTASIAREEYKFTVAEEGLQAPNRAQNFRSRYRETEVELEPRERSTEEAPAWRLSWQTKSWGREEDMRAVGAAIPEANAEGTRVTYRHDGMSEWYENRKEGLEQGFTVAERPAGAGPLRIEGEFGGAARPVLREDGAIDLLDENDVALVRYGELVAWDARGEEIESSLAVSGTSVAIVVDDRHAQYPITIDPLLKWPAWSAESNNWDAEFGWSVAKAGDVNGDGYSDVIVGARFYSNDEDEEGRAYVYYGSPAGLSTIALWTIESNQYYAHLGYSVATAGDVNNDGFSDVIVGAPNYTNDETSEGRVFVFHGSAFGLDPSPARVMESNKAYAWFGNSVATAGDVNGDRFSDVIVGAEFYGNIEPNEGRAYVFHGSATGLVATPAWITEGNQMDAGYGFWVSTAGDVNNDELSDVVVSARWYDNPLIDEGRAYVFHGTPAGLASTPAWTADSNQEGALFGSSVSTAGDVNNDGFSDVVIGAAHFSNGEFEEGRAYLYPGSASGLAPNPTWTAEGGDHGAVWFGTVSTAEDVNGDGYSDVAVGTESFFGKAFVYYGSAAGLVATPAWQESIPTTGSFGFSVASAGDVNGDGFSDLIVGHPDASDDEDEGEGMAYVFNGSPNGLGHSWRVESNQNAARFGYSVSTAGDVNGDELSDVIVGAIYYDNGQPDEGRVFVYHGTELGLSLSPAWSAESNQANAGMGNAVANAGDVNGDGYGDVVVGAWQYDNGQIDEGRAYIFHGSPTGLLKSPARILEGNQISARFGSAVSTAGKVNGDTYSDVLIGAEWFDNGQGDEGLVFVFHGSATGIGPSPSWKADSNQANAWFGHSVSTAGDVNHDTFSDIIVGAPYFSNGQSQEGRAFVYHGSLSGLLPAATWKGESNQSQALYGQDVSTAGDVNGDGFSDVIVGAHRFDGPQVDEGRAWVYAGSPTGLALYAAWTGDPDEAGGNFGWSVASAGDVNDDGFSDVLVGAPKSDESHADEGFVFAYLGSGLGLGSSPDWKDRGHDSYGEYGYDVSTAGDVNGDGFSDVIIGSPLYDEGPENNEGLAVLYYGYAGGGLSRGIPPARLGRSDSSPVYAIANREEGRKNSEEVATVTTPTTLLEGGSPNPFIASTEVAYNVPQAGRVHLRVYSVTGQLVAMLVDDVQVAGRYRVRWDGRDRQGQLLPAGVYFARLELGDRIESQKLVLAR